MSQELRKDNLTLMPSKYPEELRARATRLAVEARKDPDTRTGAISRIAEQTGVHKEALRTWVRSTEDAELPTGDVDSVEDQAFAEGSAGVAPLERDPEVRGGFFAAEFDRPQK